MRFYILRASLTNQINAGYSPRPSLFVVGTFIACSYTSMVAFAKYLEILLMASFELHIAAFKYGGWGLCILIHIVIALKLFVMRSMFVFISELLQEFVIPKGLDFHYQTNTVYTQEGGNTSRGQFSTPATVLSHCHSSFQPQIQTLCTKSYQLSLSCKQGN